MLVGRVGDAITNRNVRQAFGEGEGLIPDAVNAIANRDTGKAGAESKGPITYAGDAVRNGDAL